MHVIIYTLESHHGAEYHFFFLFLGSACNLNNGYRFGRISREHRAIVIKQKP